MLAASKERAQALKQYRDMKENISPERTKVWVEPKPIAFERKKVAVIYYLSRNGILEQPHFMELSLSYTEGLHLRDFINKFNVVRGLAVAKMYSWSSKRSYMNGFVWHDLCEDDFIYPVRGNEYVLKGTEILHFRSSSTSLHSSIFSSSTAGSKNNPHEVQRSVRDDTEIALARRKKTTCRSSSFDINEYKAYKDKQGKSSEFITLNLADASTQTDDRIHRKQAHFRYDINKSGSLKSLRKVDHKRRAEEQTSGSCSSTRMRTSALMMHLLSCASVCETKEQTLSSVLPYCNNKRRTTHAMVDEEREILDEAANARGIKLEDREYFSGSLIENRRGVVEEELRNLKRSSSFTACRNAKLNKELGVDSICMPRKSNTIAEGKLSCIKYGGNMINKELSSN